GVSSDPDPIMAVFTADGNVSSPSYRDIYSADSAQITPAIAARPGGGSGIVFTNERHADQSPDTRGTNITYRPVAADGTPGTALAIGEFDFGLGHDTLLHPAIATMSGGQQVVAFERVFSGTDHDIFLNVVSVDGVVTTFSPADPLEVADTVAFEADPAV